MFSDTADSFMEYSRQSQKKHVCTFLKIWPAVSEKCFKCSCFTLFLGNTTAQEEVDPINIAVQITGQNARAFRANVISFFYPWLLL